MERISSSSSLEIYSLKWFPSGIETEYLIRLRRPLAVTGPPESIPFRRSIVIGPTISTAACDHPEDIVIYTPHSQLTQSHWRYRSHSFLVKLCDTCSWYWGGFTLARYVENCMFRTRQIEIQESCGWGRSFPVHLDTNIHEQMVPWWTPETITKYRSTNTIQQADITLIELNNYDREALLEVLESSDHMDGRAMDLLMAIAHFIALSLQANMLSHQVIVRTLTNQVWLLVVSLQDASTLNNFENVRIGCKHISMPCDTLPMTGCSSYNQWCSCSSKSILPHNSR